ncbi:hypothetical protein [Parvibaculum sp.]|jgi:hypothetical protein|uniref:hypothetical protein n=1 Tax=Parvibaculum sp. TaxID=2024848 RepID=UPI0025F2EEA0|nr:hypothetical protein [Parvibaculum sp.]|tara:strand:+ start:12052 stop:12252 length:201 start_codon:yes stop_codon:yes gene_type:complete
MDVGHVGLTSFIRAIGLLALQLVHPCLHRLLIHALKGGHNASNAALDLSSALLSSSPCAGADGFAD